MHNAEQSRCLMSNPCPVPLSTVEEVVANVTPLRGQFARLTWERDCDTLKRSNPPAIRKRTTCTVRFGVSYDNIAAVKEGRADGTLPAENPGMSWGEWVKGLENYLKTHNGKYYLRVTLVNGQHPTTTFLVDGKEVDKESIDHFLSSKEKRSHTGEVFDLCLNHVQAINKVEIGA